MKEIEKKQKISAKNYEEALEEIKRLPTKEQPLNINKLLKENQNNKLNILEIKSSKDQTKIFIDDTEIKAYEKFNMSVERKNIVKISLDIICLLK